MNDIVVQLVTVVGGATEASKKQRQGNDAKSPTRQGFGKSDEVYHHISRRSPQPIQSLEHVLPLGDGNDALEGFNG